MFANVNGVRLFFDVEGAEYVANGPVLRRKPTVILLHGGLGADHAVFKPEYSQRSDIAQVIYLDHRGNGRSDQSGPDHWNQAQWGDDLRGFCDALGIERPIIIGVSFGGFVAQAYFTRHPDHIGGLVLVSTAAKFDFDAMYKAFARIGGQAAGDAARRYWSQPTVESRMAYHEACFDLYTCAPLDQDWAGRITIKNEVVLWSNGPENEQGRMDFRTDLARVTCPAMVLCGADDPVTPPAFSEVIATSLPPSVDLHIFDGCGHGVVADQPDAGFGAMRDFIENMPPL